MDQPPTSDRPDAVTPPDQPGTPRESSGAGVPAAAPAAAPASETAADTPPPPLTPAGWLVQNATFLVAVAFVIALIVQQSGLQGLITWGLVALGLGFVIFIHELGHFLAAKWCDVHVTTFSIGFGPALPGCSVQRGETTYKIAAFPLGGYVNMVGEGPEADEQEDYPRSFKNKTVGQRMLIISAGVLMNVLFGCICFVAVYLFHGVERLPAEVWRVESGSPAWRAGVRTGTVITAIDGKRDPYFDDLRMAVALSDYGEEIDFTLTPYRGGPPQRIAIEPRSDPNDLMPVIGVSPPPRPQLDAEMTARHRPAPVLYDSPAAAARAVGLRPGDELLAASDPARDGELTPLTGAPAARVAELARRMSDPALKDQPLRLEVRRGGADRSETVEVPPGGFDFGDEIVATTDPDSPDEPFRLAELPANPLDSAGKSRDAFELRRRLKRLAGRPMVFRVQRKGGTTADLLVPPAYHLTLGVRMVTGNVTAVRKGSPAEAAGVKPGDRLSKVELRDAAGQVLGHWEEFDPVRLPDQLARAAGDRPDVTAVLWVLRPNPANHREREERVLPAVPWDAGWSDNEEEPVGWASPMSVPQLGLAYLVETLVAQVEPGSPAAAAGLQPLDRIDKVRVRRVGKTAGELSWGKWNELSSRRPGNPEAYDQWAHLFWALQQLDSPQVQLQVTRNGAALAEPIELTARPDLTWPLDERGLILSPDTRLQQAHGVGEALAFGVGDTVRFIKQIYLNLRGLVTGRISYKSLGGPVEIARQAFASADNLWRLVLFLGIISVNLAVVNFLPIPVLDGGHMVFLIYEKLLGRPPSEAVRAAATYVGLALLGSLMLFVFYLDIKRLLGA